MKIEYIKTPEYITTDYILMIVKFEGYWDELPMVVGRYSKDPLSISLFSKSSAMLTKPSFRQRLAYFIFGVHI